MTRPGSIAGLLFRSDGEVWSQHADSDDVPGVRSKPQAGGAHLAADRFDHGSCNLVSGELLLPRDQTSVAYGKRLEAARWM